MTDRHPLYPDGMWVFDDDQGQEIRDGKVYYPAHLKIRMERYQALVALESLARQLRGSPGTFELDWSGTIERLEDD